MEMSIILIIFLASQIFCVELPVISVLYTRQKDTHVWIKEESSTDSYTKRGDDYTFSSIVAGIIIKCTAAFPVYWKLDSSNWGSDVIIQYDFGTFLTREVSAKQFNNTSTYMYSSTITIDYITKSVVGNYSCAAATTKAMQKSMYLYLDEINEDPPFLMRAGDFVEVEINGRTEIILPCGVVNPKIDVTLFKEVVTKTDIANWTSVPLSESVSYDPKIGFTLKVKDVQRILGFYKCDTDEPQDVVHINVRKVILGEYVSFEENYLVGKAQYYWDKNNLRFYCCSNSDKPPEVFISQCSTIPSCQLRREWMTKLIRIKKTQNLRTNLYPIILNNGSCISQEFWLNRDTSFVVNCRGDGIKLSTDLFAISVLKNITDSQPENNQTHPSDYHIKKYDIEMLTKWDNIPLAKAVIIDNLSPYIHGYAQSENNPPRLIYKSEIYSGETVIAHCRSAKYLFARGYIWATKMKNGSLSFLEDDDTRIVSRERLYTDDMDFDLRQIFEDLSQILMIRVTSEIDSIVCFAPVWNSSDWIPAYLKLNIQESFVPIIEGEEHETLYWTLNATDMTLHCKASHGIPTPKFSWTKDGKEVTDTYKVFKVTSEEDYSTLQVHLISHDIHGEYVCTASNCAGNVTKTFAIFITEPTSFAVIAGGSIIIIVFLLALISLMVHRMKKQQANI